MLRRGAQVKLERTYELSPSVVYESTAAPSFDGTEPTVPNHPSPATASSQRAMPAMSSASYAVPSYHPSHGPALSRSNAQAPAPSVRSGDDGEPLLLQTRPMPVPPPADAAPPQHEDPFVTNSFSEIGKMLKACNDTLGTLQQLGISHDISLPALVLVGDQSAGKSSLMSGLADIELPRSEGQCTRCPVHIRLSRATQWSCRVQLQRDWEHRPEPNNAPITQAMVTESNKFPPWAKRKSPQVLDFKIVEDKSDIDDVIRWAQIAVLNDRQDHRAFIPGSGAIAENHTIEAMAQMTEAKFSPNVVGLSISGPDLPDLSFYDMPGIFKTAQNDQDQYLTKVVEYLTREYVRNSDAIIMCALPMNQDAENSSAFGILREMGATSRTIGVLTKADLLPKADPTSWLRILRGEAYTVGHGYFITSRPTDQRLDELKKWEETFFEPENSYELDWPEQFHRFRERCSVERLKTFLSKKLGEEFARRLPSIKQKVAHKLGEINAHISTLPELPNNVENSVKMSLFGFESIAKERLCSSDFTDAYSNIPYAFLQTLLAMRPTFILKHPSDYPPGLAPRDGSTTPSVVDLISDESDVAPTPSKRSRPGVNGQQPIGQPAKRRQGPNGVVPITTMSSPGIKPDQLRDGSVTPAATPSHRNRHQQPHIGGFPAIQIPDLFADMGQRKCTWSLQQLHDMIQKKRGPPGLVSPQVHSELCSYAVTGWQKPMEHFLNKTIMLIEEAILGFDQRRQLGAPSALDTAMASFKSRLMYRESRRLLHELFVEKRNEMHTFLMKLFRMESFKPVSVNDSGLNACIESEGSQLRAFRTAARWIAYSSANGEELPSSQKDIMALMRSTPQAVRLQQEQKLSQDPFHQELEVASYVRGYYLLAAHRFGDIVAVAISNELLPELSTGLGLYLERHLIGAASSRGNQALGSIYNRLMEEDDETARTRERLKADKARFEIALQSIHALEAQGDQQVGEVAGSPRAMDMDADRFGMMDGEA